MVARQAREHKENAGSCAQTDADLKDSLKVPKQGGMQENEPVRFFSHSGLPSMPAASAADSPLRGLLERTEYHDVVYHSQTYSVRSSRVSKIRWHLQGAGL